MSTSEENAVNDRITVEGHDGEFAAYIARPKNSPAPAIVVLQELFGVNADIRKHCDELAEQGFIAVAPDPFWRQEPGVDLNVTSKADWKHGLRLYGAYDRDSGAKDVKDTVNAVRNLQECNGKVALLGYCLGALMVFLTAHFPMLEEKPPRKGFLEREEFEKLKNELPERLRPIVMYLYSTGRPLGEARGICRHQIDLDALEIRIESERKSEY